MNSQEQKGWLMLLSDSEDSAWGSLEEFYKDVESEAADSDVIDLESNVWGKLHRKDLRPRSGDGIAFYHTTRARFPKTDPYRRRARISLIGVLQDLSQEGQNVTWLSARIRRADLDRLRTRPIVRDQETEHLFQQCGMVRGSVATFYEVPPIVWGEFCARAGVTRQVHATSYPDEVPADVVYREGAVKIVSVNAYERNPKARARCIEAWGTRCGACGIDFGEFYGEIGEGFIHVHHLRPLGEIAGEYEINPIHDLRPVCPNCHAIIHRQEPPLSVERLAQLLREKRHG